MNINFASAGQNKINELTREIATKQSSFDFLFFGDFLPNPDPILKKMGKDQTAYDEILGDAHLSGIASSRNAGVKSLLWDIDRGTSKSRTTKIIKKVFNKINIDQFISDVLEANYRGYQAIEIIWDKPDSEGLILPLSITGKPQEWFCFDTENRLRFKTMSEPNGMLLPERKFLLARRKATYKNPYGDALLSKCFWPAAFKKAGIKFWATFVEKFGIPYIIGKLPPGAGENDYEQLAQRLQDMVQDAVAAIPNDASVEIQHPNGASANGDIFKSLIDWANGEMSKVILGHGGGADSTPGKLGGEDNAADIKQFLVDEDKRLVESVANNLIQWIFEINFSTGEPPVFSMYAEEDVDLDQATRDKSLTEQGVQFSKEYYLKAYGFDESDIVSVGAPPVNQPLPPKSPATFAEKTVSSPQQSIDDFMGNVDPKELQSQADGILKPIISMFEDSRSLEDIRDSLAGAFSDLDSDSLEKMLQRAIFVSEMLGRLNGSK